GGQSDLQNLSDARDTQTMRRLLKENAHTLDVLDAGTTMRFLTAYLTATQQDRILTGTARMCQRPIHVLVEALKELGASINYLKEEGYPPIHIKGFPKQQTQNLSIRGDISSQYISALMMIAPCLENGLKLQLTGKIGSKPYIEMTRSLMKLFGVESHWDNQIISISPQSYQPTTYRIESDWSGASYWYSFVALAEDAEIKLLGLRKDSYQGDIAIARIMQQLGVESIFDKEGVLLRKKDSLNSTSIDFSDCPDLAQTVAVICAANSIRCEMRGLESLRIKETDRILALQNELAKIGATLIENEPGLWELIPAESFHLPEDLKISTYEDHRMAMAFAPLATKGDIIIEEPDVVNKSYPGFWEHMKLVGFSTSLR
ncbi:3-phosphoshikimate 1-carboxyvinyltransferase, partial [Xanthovirga aplysinae]|uniref:3-phosphoshikimate 1-carboxyvinyltransferase n=1 Tax=Xanthovirga aplysinae TaxID=2529853 RepID=UPI0012BC33CE